MGRLILPDDALIYVDANTVIYRVESLEPYASASAPLWEALQGGRCEVVTSQMTFLEVLVKPIRESQTRLISLYRGILFDTVGLFCLPFDRETLELAATLRAEYRLKTPDAIHAATAVRSGVTLFLTNDRGFRRIAGLNVLILSEIDPF